MRSMAIIACKLQKVLSPWTPAQIKKHAECFFKQNLKTNSAAMKQYQESLSPDKKAQVLVKNLAEQQSYRQSLSPEKKSNFMQWCWCPQKQCESLPSEKKVKILQTDADAHKEKQESLSPEDKDLFV